MNDYIGRRATVNVPAMPRDPRGPITFYGNREEWERLKTIAAAEGTSASAMVAQMIRERVAQD